MADVIDNKADNRFEMAIDGSVAFVTYRRQEGVVSLNHAEVPKPLEGRGLGSKLARGTLDLIKAEGDTKVVPRCSFIRAFIERNPEYAEMVG
ncbi:MAG: N-acetyltransferase [Proteobacteria bacterium]|nr:N-acetyltransferase [Pseudomonadota bacterium]